MFRYVSRLERSYYPSVRKKSWYLFLKLIILLPFVIIAQIQRLMRYLRARRSGVGTYNKDKPPIVLANIVSGFTNLTFPNEATEQLAYKRAAICAACPAAEKVGVYSIIVDKRTKNIQGMRCKDCGCNLSAKVRSERDYCPRGKW